MTSIVPVVKTITQTTTSTSFELFIGEWILHKSARFRVIMMDDNNKMTETIYVTLSGEDYLNWGNDDQYVINFIASQLGLTILSN